MRFGHLSTEKLSVSIIKMKYINAMSKYKPFNMEYTKANKSKTIDSNK